MKKRFLPITALYVMVLAGLVISCEEPGDKAPEIINTFIVFDNTKGTKTVSVYSNPQRRNVDLISEIPPRMSSKEIGHPPVKHVFFYLSYSLRLEGINNFFLNFVPAEVGRDQIPVTVGYATTKINLPSFEEAVEGYDGLLSRNSHILIKNNSGFPIELFSGTSSIKPDISSFSSVVNAGENAQYTMRPGSAASCYIKAGGTDNSPFPIASFIEGYVYSFVYDLNNISLDREVEAKLENIQP